MCADLNEIVPRVWSSSMVPSCCAAPIQAMAGRHFLFRFLLPCTGGETSGRGQAETSGPPLAVACRPPDSPMSRLAVTLIPADPAEGIGQVCLARHRTPLHCSPQFLYQRRGVALHRGDGEKAGQDQQQEPCNFSQFCLLILPIFCNSTRPIPSAPKPCSMSHACRTDLPALAGNPRKSSAKRCNTSAT